MATRTEPIAAASFISVSPLRGFRRRHGFFGVTRSGVAQICAGRAPGTFGGDQLLEPSHLAVARFEPMALHLERVRVQPFGRAGEDVAEPFPALLYPPPPALEQAPPRLLVGPG